MVFINVDNLATNIAPRGPYALEVNLAPTIPTFGEFSSAPLAVAQGPTLW